MATLHACSCVQDCGLFELPSGLTQLTSLESLDLRGNLNCAVTPEEAAWLENQVGEVELDWS